MRKKVDWRGGNPNPSFFTPSSVKKCSQVYLLRKNMSRLPRAELLLRWNPKVRIRVTASIAEVRQQQ